MKSELGINLVATISLVLCGLPAIAFGCSCSSLPAPPEAFEIAEFVFQGTALERDVPGATPLITQTDTLMCTSSGDMVRFVFEVARTWKGDVGERVVIYSARKSSSCGLNFLLGHEYLVYGRYREKVDDSVTWAGDPEAPVMTCNRCSRTRSVEGAVLDFSFLETRE